MSEQDKTSDAPIDEKDVLAFSADEIKTYKRLRTASKGGVGRGWALFFNFLLIVALLAGLGVGGWLYQRQYIAVETALERDLPSILARLEKLDAEREESDKTLSARVNKALKDLEHIDGDILELRDIVNKRNQQWIKENAELIKRQGKDVGELLVNSKRFKSRSEVYERALETQQQMLDRIANSEENYRNTKITEQQLADNLNSLTTKHVALNTRVNVEEQSTRATTNHRKQLNRQYLEFKKQVAKMQQSIRDLKTQVNKQLNKQLADYDQ